MASFDPATGAPLLKDLGDLTGQTGPNPPGGLAPPLVEKPAMSQQAIRGMIKFSDPTWDGAGDAHKTEVASAIAMAESGGKRKARNTNSDGTVDRGMFQFNSKWHPEVTDGCADDFFCATRAMKRVSSQGSNFSAWATYTNGSYKRYMGKTKDPSRADYTGELSLGDFAGQSADLATAAVKPFEALASAVTDVLKWLFGEGSREHWIRIGKVVLGIAALIMGAKTLGMSLAGTGLEPIAAASQYAGRTAKEIWVTGPANL